MVEWRRSGALTLGLSAALLIGCGGNDQVFLLDQLCNPDTPSIYGEVVCTVSGDAELTTGITSDTTAVHLGPDTGELRIKLYAIGATSQPTWSLDVLAAASRSEGSTLFRSLTWGNCGSACPSDPDDVQAPLAQDFQWAGMVDDLPGSPSATSQTDALLTLRGADIDIIDIRTPGFDQATYYGY